MERDLNESTAAMESHQPSGPFQVPLRILIPRNIDGLVAAEKNLSMTRLVSGALRVQPICALVGQAAGALAALAARDGVAPRKITPVRVQRALLEAEVTLSLSDYSDVSPGHKFYKAVQLAGLHGLAKPNIPPFGHRTRGVFGVDKPITQDEMAVMINKARNAAGIREGADMAESQGGAGRVTRAVFLESVLNAFGMSGEPLDVLGIPGFFQSKSDFNRRITRGEAAEILMMAMTR
jgi:hypothetical protein